MADESQINRERFDAELAPALLDVVRQTYLDLHRRPDGGYHVTLDSSLDRELGFDSLGRVELLTRIEVALGVNLPESVLQTAETPRDLLIALRAAGGKSGAAPAAAGRASTPQSSPAAAGEGATLPDMLAWHVRQHGDRTHIICLSDAGEEEISYARLSREAAAVAAGLQREGLEPRQAVAIMLPTSPEYFFVYFGILLAGGIPVPIYPPARLSQVEEHVRRHGTILASARAAMLVTVREAMAVARLLEASVPGRLRVVTAAGLSQGEGEAPRVPVAAGDIAFIQYTSGSTGNPKGVVLTHANLLANIRAMAGAVHATPGDVFVSWLPLYHDMGLIGAWLSGLCVGFPLVVMSPLAFLARPERWLQAIHRYRGTLSAGPNFAYELCARKADDAHLAGLDLSSWRMAFNGAEAVMPETLRRFQERFARFGFRPETMVPVYGLAESSVGLLFPPIGRAPVIDCIGRERFERDRQALPAAATDANPLRFVACGRSLPGHEVRIVDESGREVGERVEGRLQFRGPSATGGYYRSPEETRRLFCGDWLETGDRAYLAEGDVYITGRIKDVIIRGGRNIFPHELEGVVGALPGVRKGCVAVFGSPDPQSGTERLVVLAETRETDPAARSALRDRIFGAVLDVLGEPPDEVVLAPPHAALKTSSGKIRRSATRERYEAGRVGVRSPAAWYQVVRLVMRAALPQARRWLRTGGEFLYAAYAWAVFWVIAPTTWLLTSATSRPARAWAIGRTAARVFFRICGVPLVVRGREKLPPGGPSVLVANHASYLDGIILVAALPRPYSFVAKRELDQQFIPSVYLRHLGAEFVERSAARQGAEDAHRMANAVAEQRSLAFFPEGTFRDASGLLPFRLGAFVTAARGRLPIVPVAIRGSRVILRGDRWFPRWGRLTVTIGEPILPPSDGRNTFAVAAELRDAARAVILQHCGEPDVR